MVRINRGVSWKKDGDFPQPGTVAKIVRDKAAIPGPGQYAVQQPGTEPKGGVMARGPMRPPTPPRGPGPGEYVTTEPVAMKLAGYVPLHLRGVKPEVTWIPPPPTAKAAWDYGHGVHIISVKNADQPQSWEVLSRPHHTSCKPGARIVLQRPMPYKGDQYNDRGRIIYSYALPTPGHRKPPPDAEGRSVSSLSFYGSMVMGHDSPVKYNDSFGQSSPTGKMKSSLSKRSAGDRSISVPPFLKPDTGVSFGETTNFGYESQLSSVTHPNKWWQHITSHVHDLWPESRNGKKKTTQDEQRRIANKREQEDVESLESVVVDSPSSTPIPEPSWTQRPRNGYLFSIENPDQSPRYGGAPQLTTEIPNRVLPTPSRFRTPSRLRVAEKITDKENEETNGIEKSPFQRNNVTVSVQIKSFDESKAELEELLSPTLYEKRDKIEKCYTPIYRVPTLGPRRHSRSGSGESPLETTESIKLRDFKMCPTRKDNVLVYHRSFH